MGAVLAELAGHRVDELGELTVEQLEPVMKLANAVAAIVATRMGAAAANPTRDEVVQFLKRLGDPRAV